jgi:hypothetical protein
MLTVQDDLSEFLISVTMREQSAEEVARAFVDNVILIYGVPQKTPKCITIERNSFLRI